MDFTGDGGGALNHWRERLQSDYLEHYSQINASIDGVSLTPKLSAELSLMFDHLLGQPMGQTVLDLGTGTGAVTAWLSKKPGIVATGVDSSVTQIEQAKKLFPDCSFKKADGLTYLLENPNQFDAIICNDVVEHLPTLEITLDFLSAAQHALKPGGWFFCRVPNAASLIGMHSLFADLTHYRLYSSNTLLQSLNLTGFIDVRVEPVRAASLSGKLRLVVEHALHSVLYAICGRRFEKHFTRNICAIGFSSKRHATQ